MIVASAPYVMWGVLLIFNLAVVRLLQVAFAKVNISQALKEKSLPAKAGASGRDDPPPGGDTSYSRIAGMIGSIVLACFVWALGNIVLYEAFADPTRITTIISGTGPYFLGASALFAPYAFNQLKQVFNPGT